MSNRRKYYVALTDDGFLAGVGKTKKEACIDAGDDCGKVECFPCEEAVYQYCKEFDDYNREYLSLEWDAEFQDEIFFLNLPDITVGMLKKYLEKFDDKTPIIIADADSNAVKGCCSISRNGNAIQFFAEPWGRHQMLDTMKTITKSMENWQPKREEN